MIQWLKVILRFLLGDLPEDRKWFKKLYYNRKGEIRALLDALQIAKLTGNNILLVGRRGTGKTTILKNISELPNLSDIGYIVKYLDLREVPLPQQIENQIHFVLLELNNRLQEYLSEIQLPPIKERDHFDEYNSRCNAVKIAQAKAKPEVFKKLLLIIDDIDYTPREFQEQFLQILRPLFVFSNPIVIYAVRPEAERTAKGHHDSTLTTIFRQINWIYVHPLDCAGLIRQRLFQLGPKHLPQLLRRIKFLLPGVANSEQLNQSEFIDYPLTKNQEAFLDNLSNGNIKIVLGMACVLLEYIYSHKGQLKKIPEGGYSVGLERLLGIFDIRNVEESTHALIDINNPRSRKGYGLLKSILEYVFSDGTFPGSFFDKMSELGFSKASSEKELARCLTTELDLVEPEYISYSEKVDNRELKITKYILTPKGRYYLLFLSKQPAYISKFGSSKTSITIYRERDRLYEYVLEYLRNIYSVADFETGQINVGKKHFFHFFMEMYPEVEEKREIDKPETLALALRLDLRGLETILCTLSEGFPGRDDIDNLFSPDKLQQKKMYFVLYKRRLMSILKAKYGGLNFDLRMIPVRKYVDFLERENVPVRLEAKKLQEG